MPNKNIPEPWRSFFLEIDESLSEETAFEILGGFVVTQVYGAPRTTADIFKDFMQIVKNREYKI